MLISIVNIGNSQGIRIPKSVLSQCHINDKVELEIEDNKIILKPIHNKPRNNWNMKFKEMAENEDDKLIIDDNIDSDIGTWEW